MKNMILGMMGSLILINMLCICLCLLKYSPAVQDADAGKTDR